MTDEELVESIQLIWESFMRRAPCSPPRSQPDIESAHRALIQLAEGRPDQAWRVRRALDSLYRECLVEGLSYPGTGGSGPINGARPRAGAQSRPGPSQ